MKAASRKERAKTSRTPREYKPGDIAPVSGIYHVDHGTHQGVIGEHPPAHEALMIRGEEFPPCRPCRMNVVFQIVRPISHLTHDWDFSGLVLSLLDRKVQKVKAAG